MLHAGHNTHTHLKMRGSHLHQGIGKPASNFLLLAGQSLASVQRTTAVQEVFVVLLVGLARQVHGVQRQVPHGSELTHVGHMLVLHSEKVPHKSPGGNKTTILASVHALNVVQSITNTNTTTTILL